MDIILALDPGGTTGYVVHRKGGVRETYESGQVGPDEHHLELWKMFRRHHSEAELSGGSFRIVCESFEFRQGKQRAGIVLDSKEYIGLCKLWRAISGDSVVFQTAAQAKAFVTDEKIKALDLWSPGNKHAMDAMRHLLTYQVQRQRRLDIIQKWKHL